MATTKKKTTKKSGGALQQAMAGLKKAIPNMEDVVAHLDTKTLREPSPHIPTVRRPRVPAVAVGDGTLQASPAQCRRGELQSADEPCADPE